MSQQQQQQLDPRSAKAQAKADKAFKKASRPWFKKKRYILPLAIVVIAIIASMTGGGDSDSAADGGSDGAAVSSGSNAQSASNEDEAAAQEEAPAEEQEANPYEEEYGSFKVIKESGAGDATIALPKGAEAAAVTMSHNGSANFIVSALDANNQPTADILANTIGSYKGTAAYGLTDLGEPVKLKVQADGNWTIKIAPLSSMPELSNRANGNGDAVFLYNGGASDWALKHNGDANFIVTQFADVMPNMMVNKIGNYQGTVPAVAGPSVVTINANGKWSIAAQ